MSRKIALPLLTVIVLMLGVGLAHAQDAGIATIRVSNLAISGPSVDVFVDGQPAAAGIPFADLQLLTLTPGMHSLDITPAGQGIGATIGGPIMLDLKADDRRLLYVLWTADQSGLTTLSIDEHAARQGGADDSTYVVTNALVGAPPVDFIVDGQAVIQNLAYGSYALLSLPPKNYNFFEITVAGDISRVILDLGPSFVPPTLLSPAALVGNYPGVQWEDYGTRDAEPFSTANAWDFLSTFNKYDVGTNVYADKVSYRTQVWHFNTFLQALQVAGMENVLDGDSDVTVFAPTDTAFKRMPPGVLDNLMAHPDQLRLVLSNHILNGASPRFRNSLDNPLTTLAGGQMVLAYNQNSDFTINGRIRGCDCTYRVTNGRVFVVSDVLLTPEGANIVSAPAS